MICPRCSYDNIPADVDKCPRCGFPLLEGEQAPTRVSEELERALRRDLGGQYEIAELLGRGGMSLVYLAYEVALSRPVALKVLPLQFIHDPESAKRFEREAKIAAALDHPHIIPVFRVGATGTFLWYAMKYIKGRSLSDMIETDGALALEGCLQILEQVGSALQYAHRHGVVHRDVKPANVMVEPSGWALMCDFGVARAFGSVALTRTGGSLGTPRYMSPEQFEGKTADVRSDQYSLAVMTYEALSGAAPFGGETIGELIRQHLLEPPPRLLDARPDLPAAVSDALVRAMSKNPADRFADVTEFVQALGTRAVPRIPGAAAAAPPPPGPRGRSPLLVPDRTPSGTVATTPRPWRPPIPIPWRAAAGLGAVALALWAVLQSRGPSAASLPLSDPGGAAPDTSRRIGTPPSRAARVEPTETTRAAVDSPAPVRRRPDAGDRSATAPGRDPAPVPPVTSPRQPPGKLSVSTSVTGPWGRVYVDGRLLGNTPIMDVDIPAGKRDIQVWQGGYIPFDTSVVVAPGQRVRLIGIDLKSARP